MEAAIKVYKVCGTKECDDEHATKRKQKKIQRLRPKLAETKR
jgi:hypothetical protein